MNIDTGGYLFIKVIHPKVADSSPTSEDGPLTKPSPSAASGRELPFPSAPCGVASLLLLNAPYKLPVAPGRLEAPDRLSRLRGQTKRRRPVAQAALRLGDAARRLVSCRSRPRAAPEADGGGRAGGSRLRTV
nr:uncharacterized protein LOC106846658 isoform X2 [Equus asinus]